MSQKISARWLPEEFWEFAKKYPNDEFEVVYSKYEEFIKKTVKNG